MPPSVIITADDFGMSSPVNQAIAVAFERNWITRASIMANMPAFEEACSIARRLGVVPAIGLHLNLAEGRPLTAPIARCSRFCDPDGRFRPRRVLYRLSTEERRAIDEEFQAQFNACIVHGLRPRHIDSHHHHHNLWPVGTLTIRLAHRNGIPAIRLMRTRGPRMNPLKALYRTAFNARLQLRGLASTRHFGSLREVGPVLESSRGPVEIMVHPRLDASGAVIDVQTGQPLDALLAGFSLLRIRQQLQLPAAV